MSKLFSPLDIGALAISHRLILPGLVQLHEVENATHPIPQFDYAERATAQGLLISEPCYVSSAGSASVPYTGLEGPGGIGRWRQVTDAVHCRGGLIVAQLSHLGRLAHSSVTGQRPCAPSSVPARCMVRSIERRLVTAEAPLPLDQAGIDWIIAEYRDAASRAISAGFDGVELNSADGHLPNQFIDDMSNRRTDRYGGSLTNRITFLAEVVDALIKVCGAQRVGVRISPYSEYNDAGDSKPLALYATVLRELRELEIAYVHLVRSDRHGGLLGHRLFDDPDAARTFRAAFSGMLLVSGEFTRELAIEAVQSRWADAIGFGKSFINEPDLAKRLLDI
jgi:N-ethylmaleimide reductase